MSLTSELKTPKSPIAMFFKEQFPKTRRVLGEYNPKLRTAETITPDKGIASTQYYPLLGTAIDYRFRYYFPATNVTDLVAWRGAIRLSRDVPIQRAAYSSDLYDVDDCLRRGRDILDEALFVRFKSILGEAMSPSSGTDILGNHKAVDLPTLPFAVLEGFFKQLRDLLAELMPAGRLLDDTSERLLARYCIVLALFEACFRRGPDPRSLLFNSDITSAQGLLDIAQDSWVNDLCALSKAFYRVLRVVCRRIAS